MPQLRVLRRAAALFGAAIALPAWGVVDRDCALAEADCSLGDTARRAGVFVGAAVTAPPGSAEEASLPLHFNSLTAENAMKWGELARRIGEYDFSKSDALVAFAENRGVRVRGHTLVWPRGPLPEDLVEQVESAADPAARLREILREHIGAVAGRYAGRVESWDVLNEPFEEFGGRLHKNLFFRVLGPGYIAELFQLAHEADPEARLFLNEFILGYSTEKARAVIDLVAELRAQGVPIHGVGIQGHENPGPFVARPPDPAFAGFLAELALLGVDVEVTELDITLFWFRNDADPLAGQAASYGAVAAACMAEPACTGITTWGTGDASTWLDYFFPYSVLAPNRPLLLDESLAPKPAYFAVRDAVAARAVTFADQAAALLQDFDRAVAAGTLRGRGFGLAARARVAVLRRWLNGAARSLEGGRYALACLLLELAGDRLDGEPRPGDLASGPAVPALLGDLSTLGAGMRCDEP